MSERPAGARRSRTGGHRGSRRRSKTGKRPVGTATAAGLGSRNGGSRSDRGLDQLGAAALGAAIPLVLAFNGGGVSDVFRQEFALVVWWALALAVVFGLVPAVSKTPGLRAAFAGLAALVAWTAASLIWTESAERTYTELARVLALGGLLVAVGLGVGRHNWRAAAGGVFTAMLVLPLFAVASRLFPDAFDVGFVAEPERLSYPLEYWNAVASWAAMAVAAGIGLSAHLRSQDARALCAIGATIAGVAIYLTYSRGGAAAAIVGVAVVVALSRNRGTAIVHTGVVAAAVGALILVIRSQPEIADGSGGAGGAVVAVALLGICGATGVAVLRFRRSGLARWRPPARITRAGALLVLLIAIGGGVAYGSDIVGDAREEFVSGGSPDAGDDPAGRLITLQGPRGEVWASALRAFGAEPALGIGPGTFQLWWTRDVEDGEALRNAHSLYLETLAELGIVGLLLLGLLLLGLLAGCLRAARVAGRGDGFALALASAAAFVAFLVHAGVDWMWESTAVAALALITAAVAAASLADRRRRRLRGWRAARLAAVCIVAGAVQVPPTVATERQRASFSSLLSGRVHEAETRISDAIEATPWAAGPYAARAFIRIAREDGGGAIADAGAAVSREPTNWRHRVLLATALARIGDDEGAAAALAKARALNPGTRIDFDDLETGAERPGTPLRSTPGG